MEIRKEVPNGTHAPAQARRIVDSVPDLPGMVAEKVKLALSELVTNSYQHAGNPEGAPISIILKQVKDRLRLEVIDRSIFDPTPETIGELELAKWGLAIVDRVADDWGRISEGGIWAEFELSEH